MSFTNNKSLSCLFDISAEFSEIRHYFANPLLLPAEDRHYCSSNLDKLLRSRLSVRRRWLRRVRTARANMLKNGQSQTTIYNFFPTSKRQDSALQPRLTDQTFHETLLPSIPTQPTLQQTVERIPGRPPDNDNVVPRTTQRIHATQQRMTKFFPG